MTLGREIEDGEAAMAEEKVNVRVLPCACAVGAAMSNGGGHGFTDDVELSLGLIRAVCKKSRNTTHSLPKLSLNVVIRHLCSFPTLRSLCLVQE